MAQTLLTVLKISVIIAIPSSMIVLALIAGRPFLKELFGNPKLLINFFLEQKIRIQFLQLKKY